jgi:hypothetical protein
LLKPAEVIHTVSSNVSMIRSAITICLVAESRSGPFVFHADPDSLLRHANSTVNGAGNLKSL